MIMHGDGHGGIHYHDGFVDVNGIFPARFDLVLTNPPFGANVGKDQIVGSTQETRVANDPTQIAAYEQRFGEPYAQSYARMALATKNKTPILDLYEIGRDKPNRPTEILFIERCLDLLKPGGRLGIVLPDSILNNPSLDWVRRWTEGKARLLAVVSLPSETFVSSKATVKASILFLQRFSAQDEVDWQAAWAQAQQELDPGFDAERAGAHQEYDPRIASYDRADLLPLLASLESFGITPNQGRWHEPEKLDVGSRKRAQALKQQFTRAITSDDRERRRVLQRELDGLLKEINSAQDAALWARVRELFDYPIFFAEPERVGITSTGADGPNDFPEVVKHYRQFQEDPERFFLNGSGE
jgi:type I restriction enzyme M protein